MSLELRGAVAGYGPVTVLRGVDLVVPRGSVVALLGANGAGKTTLLKAIAGLLPLREGTLNLDGVDLTGLPAHRRARAGVALVPEGRGVYPRLTVVENLAMQVDGRDVDRAVEVAVTAFPVLGERLRQQAGTLSGGEQQMLAVSRVLVHDDAVVMADELSLGLAPVIIDQIFEALAAVTAAGRSLLVVEQYARRVLDVADWVYILHKGSVAFVGEPTQCGPGVLAGQFEGVHA